MALRSRDEHDLIRLQEREENLRSENDIGSRVYLRASRHPFLEDERISEPTDALVVT